MKIKTSRFLYSQIINAQPFEKKLFDLKKPTNENKEKGKQEINFQKAARIGHALVFFII